MAQNSKISFLAQKMHPAKIATTVILVMLVLMLILRLTSDQELESNKLFYWEIALVFALVYALFSCVFSLISENKFRYFGMAIVGYLFVAAIGILLATYLSGLSISEAGSFEWLFKLFSFSYLVLISVFNLMSKVMEIIKKQDEQVRREQNRTSK